MKNPAASDQQRQASDPGYNIWVAANAGSGKTHVLVDRVIRLLLDGAEPQRILCLTFTKAAAAEMANRLFERLGKWVMLDDAELGATISKLGAVRIDAPLLARARQLFTLSLEAPGGLKIQTIHAFCERLLQLFPVEAGVVPGFEVMDDRAVRDLLESARRIVLAEAQRDDCGIAARALLKIIPFVREDSFDALIQIILSKRSDLGHILTTSGGVQNAIAALRESLGRPPDFTQESFRDLLSIDMHSYRKLADVLRAGSDRDRERSESIRSVLAQPSPTLNSLRTLLLTKRHEPKKIQGIATKTVTDVEGWIAGFVAAEQLRLITALAAQSDLDMLEATEALLELATAIVARYEDDKRKSGRYDFDDLIAQTRSLLTRSGAAQWVLYKLDGGIDHILIDEAQDTSPAQWQIAAALAEEFFAGQGARAEIERTLFAVGDRKQSIFSFQGADPDAFVQASDHFELIINASGRKFRRIPLHISYRSTKRVLQAVDTVFAQPQALRGVEARIDTRIEHRPERTEDHGLVELWPLLTADDQTVEQPWRAPVDAEPQNHPRRKLAAKVARRIAGWIGKRYLPSQARTVKPSDILILVQRRNAFFDALIRELRRQGVPVAGADRLKLAEHIAVRDVLALAQFTLLPEDDYTLACLLKSPLVARADGIAIHDADLFDLAHDRGRASLWQRLRTTDNPQFVRARIFLERWLAIGPALSPYEFFARLLVESRADLLKRLGHEANDPLDALLDAALDFEQAHTPTLPAFLSWLLDGETEIKRDMDQGANEVRIMTVHGAKGLEANIVILPDSVDLPDNRQRPPVIMVRPDENGPLMPFWVLSKMPRSATVQSWCDLRLDSAGDEYRRLLYVAMTRARDELYVCGWYNKQAPKPDCWYELVRTAIAPIATQCESEDGDMLLRVGHAEAAAVAQSPIADHAAAALPKWLAEPVPSTPRMQTIRPSVVAETNRSPLQDASERRFGRGRLIHRLLQFLPDLPVEQRRPAALRLALWDGHGEDVAQTVLDLIEHPQYADFFAASGLAEVPIVMRGEDGTQVSGQIDRLLVGKEDVLILDYKSDATPPRAPEDVSPAYLVQLAAYRGAVRLAFPERRVRAALLWTAAPSLMEIPDLHLDRAAMRLAPPPEAVREP